jgi:hypothetical protein
VLEDRLVAPTAAAVAGTLLERRTFTYNGQPRELQLLRLPTADGRVAYAEWIPPLPTDGGPQAAVLLTLPYDGIDWSGEAVDARWSQACPTGSCLLPDVDGPGGGPDAGVITYSVKAPEALASDATLWLLNGMGVLGVYGRFYAGESWWAYAQDMVAGLRFLGTSPDVDRQRVGVFGGSLGGYEAFYAAAYAPPEVQPKALVPMYPPVDLAAEVDWATRVAPGLAQTQARRDQLAAFFDPYLRRMVVDTGGLPEAGGDFRCFALGRVVPRVSGEVLVVQDDWDLLVGPANTRALLAALGGQGNPIWYLHPDPPDVDALPLGHGPFDSSTSFPTYETFAAAFLLTRLGPGPSLVVPYQGDVMQALLQQRWRDQSRAGLQQPGAADRLADLADPRVTLYELASGQTVNGAQGVSAVLQSVWGVAVPADQAASWLRTHGLPP